MVSQKSVRPIDCPFRSGANFHEYDGIRPGADFVKTIEKKVSECDVLVAVIGERWLTSSDGQGGRRLDNPEDFVRMEIATALKREIWVIPFWWTAH